MLATLTMPDGSPCKGFHAAAIMSQLCEFKGWSKGEAFDAFDKATAVLANQPVKFTIWPCAVATAISKGLTGRDRDAIWLALFLLLHARTRRDAGSAQHRIWVAVGLL